MRIILDGKYGMTLHRPSPLCKTYRRLGACFKDLNAEAVYVMDSFPVPVCDNIRIKDAQIYGDEAHRGYIASKRRYF